MKITFSFDWKDLSEDGFITLEDELKRFGIYLYDLDQEVNKEATSDQWILTMSNIPLTKEELVAEFEGIFPPEDLK